MTEKTSVIETSKSEIEFKFESISNTQIKFVPIDSNETIIRKVQGLCSILEIELGQMDQINIDDEYYDFGNVLGQSGISCRRRVHNGRRFVTFKLKQKGVSDGAVHRSEDEFELNDEEFRKFIESPTDVSKRISEHLDIKVGLSGKMKNILTIHNERTSIPLKTTKASYKFCFDKYHYFYPKDGTFSEYQAEVEIELDDDHLPDDLQLTKLRGGIHEIFGYTPSHKSKLERGLERLHGQNDDVENVYSIGLDIIGYSMKSADVQKQMIQHLNRVSKLAIRDVRGEGSEREVIYLPTGDGMIMIFKDKPDTILRIVFNIQRMVKEDNKLFSGYAFRTGLHAGPVFKYSDVNENNNFAGNGINHVQRVMSLGDEWHILATVAAMEAMGKTRRETEAYFHDIGEFEIKHSEKLHVYNVFSQDKNVGNSTTPT